MKNIAGIVMLLIAGGNILVNAEQYNREHPLVWVAEAQEVEPRVILIGTTTEEIVWSKERIKEEVKTQAEKHNVPFGEMWETILCESGASTTIQSHHKYAFTDVKKGIYKGEREKSFGIAQIHLPDHTTVTKEQALDPLYSITFMAENWNKVRWYCRK